MSALDSLTVDLYNALNGKFIAETSNTDLRDQLSACHKRIKELAIFEENLKDQVVVNQLLYVEREQAIAEREKAISDLNFERNTIKGWCDASVTAEKFISSQRLEKSTRGLGFVRKNKAKQDTSMLKFGTFVSSIPIPDSSQCSSSFTHTEGTLKGLSSSAKGKAKADTPSKTKLPKLKKVAKPIKSGPSASGKKPLFQNPVPKLRVDFTSKNEEMTIPPISEAKGLLGPGPAHLRLKKPKGPEEKHFSYRKCHFCGLKTHIASKCPSAPKAEKSVKGKKSPEADLPAKGKDGASIVSDSSPPTNQSGPSNMWVSKKT